MNRPRRAILRWLHLLFCIPILGYAYSPFAQLPQYAPLVRWLAIPMTVATGLLMWQGHRLRGAPSRAD